MFLLGRGRDLGSRGRVCPGWEEVVIWVLEARVCSGWEEIWVLEVVFVLVGKRFRF